MAKSIRISEEIAIAATDVDVLAGKRIKNIPPSVRRATVRIYETGSAAGLTTAVWAGDRNPKELSAVGDQAVPPRVPEDQVAEFSVRGGDELYYYANNPTAGALTLNALIVIQ